MTLEKDKLEGKKSRKFPIRQHPEIFDILLKDRTTNKNIIWATENYIGLGKSFLPEAQLKLKNISNEANKLVQPRMKKDFTTQLERTKEKAEVFTPLSIVKIQNDVIEKEFSDLSLEEYVGKKWLEITCGEAPYMCTRYDAVSGKPIEIQYRVGFIDRKIQKISREIDNEKTWLKYTKKAIKSSYGYEYHGDSLLIARENILYSFIDYYFEKFHQLPLLNTMKEIAEIISYNVFQMDGLKYTIPYSEEVHFKKKKLQFSLFDENNEMEKLKIIKDGTKVRIKDWSQNESINFERLKIGGSNMKFDVIIGNPPYQESISNRGEQPAIYNLFMNESYKIADRVCLITPARFLSNVGSTPKKWNKKMLSDEHLKIVYFNKNSSEVFSDTDIKGGVVITYHDNNRKFGSIGTFITHKELKSILEKVGTYPGNKDLSTLLYSNTSYKYSDLLLKRYPEFDSRLSGGSRRYLASSVFDILPEMFCDKKPSENGNYIQIMGRQNNQRKLKYVRRDLLKIHPNLDKYKVFVASSNGSGKLGEVLSSPLIGEPKVGSTETFITFGSFDNKYEAENLLKYIKTKFSRVMLSILKVTQGNKTKHVWSKVPLQDFSDSSDINWTKSIIDIDKQLYKKYKLSQKEIYFIETNVKEML